MSSTEKSAPEMAAARAKPPCGKVFCSFDASCPLSTRSRGARSQMDVLSYF